MKKVLIIAIVILSLLLAALAGLIWYQGSHVFVEGTAYAKNAEVVDLRGQNISEAHYLTVQQALPDSRVIWDVTGVSWLLNDHQRFMRSRLMPTPLPGYDHRWHFPEGTPLCRYVYYVSRDDIFTDMFAKLAK